VDRAFLWVGVINQEKKTGEVEGRMAGGARLWRKGTGVRSTCEPISPHSVTADVTV